jgi:hypothetical protein
MIQDIDKTLEKLIYERGRMNRNDIDISFEQPNGDWSARISRPTLNIWCFDIQENLKLRTMEPRTLRNAPGSTRQFPPLRLDITYLVTAWARKVEDEHQLLWRALGTLAQVPVLDPRTCEGALKDQPYDIQLLVANMPDRMPNLSDLWSVLNNQMRLGFTLVMTLAMERGIDYETPLVLEADVIVGQTFDPLSRSLAATDVTLHHGAPRPADQNGESETKTGRRRKS